VIEPCTSIEQPGWLRLREALWPDCTLEEHLAEMALFCANPERYVQFMAYSSSRDAIGFIEASVRTDYVNGTNSSPVAFIEGIYVAPEARHKGVATSLVDTVERWARGMGCTELASDALLDNESSHSFHRAIGFEETERVVYFRKALGPQRR
jgi:aminoglycoside 6'-N-acetyltransferase I